MTSDKKILVFCVLLLLCSCNGIWNENEPRNSLGIVFCPRECETVHLDGYHKISNFSYLWQLSATEIVADSLFLFVEVTSPDGLTTSDKYMEDQITRWFIQSYGKIGNYPEKIEYRQEFCKSLTLVADKTLFGREAGQDLSDKFEFYDDAGRAGLDFLFDGEKKLVGLIREGMSIEEYLSYEPVMFAMEYLRLKEIPEEAPVNVEFTVNIELSDGKRLSDTYAITLLDKRRINLQQYEE